MFRFFGLCFLFILIGGPSRAQQANAPRFHASLLAGINATQVDGDNLAGYHKGGWNAGLGVDATLHKDLTLGMELLFSQKGSRSTILPPASSVKLLINYAEIPIMLRYHDRNGAIFGLGLSYGAYLNHKQWQGGVQVPSADTLLFARDLEGLAEFSLRVTEHFFLNARFGYSLIPVARWGISRFRHQAVYNNVLTFRMGYVF